MELAIALGIGLWFVVCGAVSYIHVFKGSKNDKEDKK